MSKPKATTTPPPVEIESDATVRSAGPPSAKPPSSSTSSKARPPPPRPAGSTLAEVEQWKDDFITQGTEALRSHPRDLAQQFEAREKTLLAKVGELTLHVDVLKKRIAIKAGTCRKGSRGSHAKPTP